RNIEDEEIKQDGIWTVLARFYSLRNPNQTALFEDMSRAWRLRSDMTHKSLRDNLFIITFSTEGDYKFVLQGGPWLHKGDALLVAAFDGLTCPSKIPLETVPIWIRIYDLPLVLMTKARGQLYGSRFGCVREVDVEEDGRNRHDFFRIRVDLPVKKPLKPKIAIKMHVQGKEETSLGSGWTCLSRNPRNQRLQLKCMFKARRRLRDLMFAMKGSHTSALCVGISATQIRNVIRRVQIMRYRSNSRLN
ncbi:Os07g0417800, partial [Oryza sativa Japonica Group]